MTWNRRYDRWVAVAVCLTVLAVGTWLGLPTPERASSAASAVTSVARDLPPAAPRTTHALSPVELRAAMHSRHAVTRNLPKYGPLSADTTIIVVQVHQDGTSLRRLIDNLSRVLYIQSTLLIFSHAYYDDGINESVDSVNFCRTMQLFYPYSVQLNPKWFPGLEESGENVAWRVETKLHWWWQAHYVFDNIGGAAGDAPVLFLQEQHVVAPDMLYMLRHAQRALAELPSAHVLALGREPARRLEPDLLLLDAWRPPYDVGLAFNRTTWIKIAALAIQFCTYEDCSWSYSLLNVFAAFPGGRCDMVACVAPRVLVARAGRPAPAWVRQFPTHVRAVYAWTTHARLEGPAAFAGTASAADCARLRDQLFCLDPLIDIDTDYFNDTAI
ncbi:alpha-1,6-mannosyl-glycoprotein 2-beta-N-acetylglucosaminyltransferase-like [Pectinophora gossypiella]|uniref:alpha-1,6-mannosyl-glycoprotein 2-beta-N-acetylglucosaminyltransferase-like n=1 Tax=Pectinophora gossypiella TaxID=13191 RepID=UPI00214F5787|nr:alpha-1,6-mannosyl-glycoprotein 2-beta-N-acetylglucosaminyltransferase-like [Pectinophora gossypiella]